MKFLKTNFSGVISTACKYDALENADAIVLVTEWKEFRSPDFDLMRLKMKGNLFIDGRNQFRLDFIQSKGFQYIQIGVKA